MNGFTLRQNLMMATNYPRAKTAIKDLSRKVSSRGTDSLLSGTRGKSSSDRRASARRDELSVQQMLERQKLKPEEVFIDQSKALEARDYILKISKIRVESQYQPYNYEYLDRKDPRFNIAVVQQAKSTVI